MISLFILVISLKYSTSGEYTHIKYTWREENDNFDFIVGISVEDVPVCAGVVIASNIILTSVNPLVGFYKLRPKEKVLIMDRNVKVHVIYLDWYRNYAVYSVYAYPQFLSCTGSANPSMDLFAKECPYTPTHDLMTLTTELNVTCDSNKIAQTASRYAFPVNISNSQRIRIQPKGTFTIAGFGFADDLHIAQNFDLEAVDYRVEQVLVDCDGWLPKHWGYFICILNIENFDGIDSGASLLHNGVLIGLGSFSLLRGNESILVFTDLRQYKTLFFDSEGYPTGSIW